MRKILLFVLLVPLCLVGCAKSAPAVVYIEPLPTPVLSSAPTTSPVPTPSPTATPVPASTAVLMLTGDIMCLSGQQASARMAGGYDFTGSFERVKPLFDAADYVMGNLETLVSDSGPLTSDYKVDENGYPYCNAPVAFLSALQYAGYDGFVTANNHCCDLGLPGILDTLSNLTSVGFDSTGTFAAADSPRFLLKDISGIRVGVLSYCEFFNGKVGTLSREERDVHINAFSQSKAEADAAAARAAGAEFLIAFTHWGDNNTHVVSSSQEQHAMALAEVGVDMIVGSHPHVLQPAAILQTKEGRSVLCLYSMGNFISSMLDSANNDTIILRLDLRKEAGTVSCTASYIPCRVLSTLGNARHVVVPVSPALKVGEATDDFAAAHDRIAAVLGNDLPEYTIP